MKKVILDTNALMMVFQFRIDLEKELERILGKVEILVPSSVIRELEKIRKWEARASLNLAKKYKIIEVEKDGDNSILDLAKSLGAYVVTNDGELRKRLKENRIRVIYLRNYSHLVVDGE